MIKELYDTYYKELLGWCRTMTQDSQQAEDLVQEAFLRALTNAALLENLREQQKRAWLYRTVKNLYIDKIRHTSFETIVEEMPETAAEADEIVQLDYEQLIWQLPEEEQVLFIMRYLQGYNSAELGQLFDIPSGTVRAKLSSARKRLRQILQE